MTHWSVARHDHDYVVVDVDACGCCDYYYCLFVIAACGNGCIYVI